MKTLLKIESSGCDTFCDLHHYQFHSTLAQLIASTIGMKKLNIPEELYREYQTCITTEISLYCEVTHPLDKKSAGETSSTAPPETLRAIRPHTDSCYHRIRELIYATYLLATANDEREELEFLIYKLNQITIQTKMLHYNQAFELKKE